MTRDGRICGGKPFTKGRVHYLLSNVIYTGRVNHKGQPYPGEHQAIVDTETWDQVQTILQQNGTNGGADLHNKYHAVLRGLLFCVPCGVGMIHSCTVQKARRYRYYVCYNAQQKGWDSCPTKSVPAHAVEKAVVDAIRRIGANPTLAAETLHQAREQIEKSRLGINGEHSALHKRLRWLNDALVKAAGEQSTDRLAELQDEIGVVERRLTEIEQEVADLERNTIDERDLKAALARFDPVWESLKTPEQIRLLRALIDKVGVDGPGHKITVSFRSAGIKDLCQAVAVKGVAHEKAEGRQDSSRSHI
jgi:site-specific DNA recombinase